MGVPGNANALLLTSAAAAGGYQVSRSLRFNAPDSSFLSRTFASAGNRKTWTFSAWVKRSSLTGTNEAYVFNAGFSSDDSRLQFNTSDNLSFRLYQSGSTVAALASDAVYRDFSAWLHLVLAVDTTQATSTDRVKLYVNGSQVTLSGSYPTQNLDTSFNAAQLHTIGSRALGLSYYFNGYLADIHFIDGQALTPSSFTEVSATTGQLVPKAYTGTYGTNGFKLTFSDNSNNTATTLGKDTSGNNNNWTPNNLQAVTGGPTSVAAASGGLPVYNTTDTYGTTKGTGTRTDSNSSSIVLAVPMDGANNGTTFTDESATIKGSGSAKTITRNGDTKTSTAQSKYYGSSAYFDGAGDSLTFPAGSDFAYGTGDFSIEGWFYQTQSYTVTGGSLLWAQTVSGSNYFTIWAGVYSQSLTFVFGSGGGTTITGPSYSLNTWNHFAVVRSGTTLTVYLNGVGVAGTCSFDFSNTTYVPTIGRYTHSDAQQFQGYIQDLRVYKGVAKYTGNFTVVSSTQNTTTARACDSLVDTPTSYGTGESGGDVRGNYATLNPLAGTVGTLSNGNLDCSTSATISHRRSTFGMTSGKWYWECTPNSSSDLLIGIVNNNATFSGNASYPGGNADGWSYYQNNGSKYNNGGSAYGASYTTGDIIGVAFDADAGTLTFYKNGTSQGQAFSGLTSGPYFAAVGNGATADRSYSMNFGQRPFAYPVSGFKALCDTNLTAPVVAKPSTVMDVKLWTGNGSTQTISGYGFSPDFVWVKQRSSPARSPWLTDTVRGVDKLLASDQTSAEVVDTNCITAFNSDGFNLADDAGFNASSCTYVGWAWDAGSSTATNTQGSITSTVRANASAGFSIISFTGNETVGATLGHGLGAKPGFAIFKDRNSGTRGFYCYHSSLGATQAIQLSSTAAASASSTWFNNTEPTSTVFTLANNSVINGASSMICWAWTPVAGYSSFGSYTGNGSTNGPFVFLGFRPALVMVKMSSSTGNWTILDDKREGYNVDNDPLYPNLSNAEGTTDLIDITSNGFKVRTTDATFNTNAGTYIYAAWASSPFAYSRAR